jgi:hypothetical protein
MTRRVLIAVTACLLATACTDDPEVSTSSSSSVASPAASAPAASPSAAPASSEGPLKPVFAADTGRDEQAASGGPLAVTEVRAARQDGYDRVVFVLDGREAGQPGWTVEYVDEARQDGSGDRVDVEGEARLSVRISGVGYPMDTGIEQQPTAPAVPPDAGVVRDVVVGSVFEGVFEAFVGTSREAPFRVFRLEDPARVVLDVRHR